MTSALTDLDPEQLDCGMSSAGPAVLSSLCLSILALLSCLGLLLHGLAQEEAGLGHRPGGLQEVHKRLHHLEAEHDYLLEAELQQVGPDCVGWLLHYSTLVNTIFDRGVITGEHPIRNCPKVHNLDLQCRFAQHRPDNLYSCKDID